MTVTASKPSIDWAERSLNYTTTYTSLSVEGQLTATSRQNCIGVGPVLALICRLSSQSGFFLQK